MIWGPLYWNTLHTLTYKYPENPTPDIKQKYIYFFNYVVPIIIPCHKCQKHFLKQLRDKPIQNNVNNKKQLIQWLIDIHNSINITKHKRIYSIEEVNILYENKINIKEIYKLLYTLSIKVQYGYLDLLWYHRCIYFIMFVLRRQ